MRNKLSMKCFSSIHIPKVKYPSLSISSSNSTQIVLASCNNHNNKNGQKGPTNSHGLIGPRIIKHGLPSSLKSSSIMCQFYDKWGHTTKKCPKICPSYICNYTITIGTSTSKRLVELIALDHMTNDPKNMKLY